MLQTSDTKNISTQGSQSFIEKTTDDRFILDSDAAIWRTDLDQPMPLDLTEEEQAEHIYKYSYFGLVNDACAELYGCTRQEMIGLRLATTFPEAMETTMIAMREFVRAGYSVRDLKTVEVDLHGRKKVFLNDCFGIIEDGRLTHIWGTTRDITPSYPDN
ncbi:MAG: PAS domain-containing protein [Gammaproteobacteria bacterium]|nr:PAS domain-containing protein [Gammaproteobacteria bacterium]